MRGVRYQHPLSRDAYLQVVGEANVGMLPFRNGLVWSMSAVDLMIRGVPVIGPAIGAIPEILPEELVFDSDEEGYSLLDRLRRDAWFRTSAGVWCQRKTKVLGSDLVARRLLVHLRSAVQRDRWAVAV